MNNHEKFGRKVLAILEENWDEDVTLEIAKLAENLGLGIGADDGEFEAIKPYKFQRPF